VVAALTPLTLRARTVQEYVKAHGKTRRYEKLREVAKLKMADLNTDDEEMAMNIIAGSARSMGVRVEG